MQKSSFSLLYIQFSLQNILYIPGMQNFRLYQNFTYCFRLTSQIQIKGIPVTQRSPFIIDTTILIFPNSPEQARHSSDRFLFLFLSAAFYLITFRPQHCLYFLPLPHGQGSFGYTFSCALRAGPFCTDSSLFVPVTLATCSLSTFCSIRT